MPVFLILKCFMKMNNNSSVSIIRALFKKHDITELGFIPFETVKTNPSKSLPITSPKTLICFLMPYKTKKNTASYISKYAAVKDYHLYARRLFSYILPELRELFAGFSFYGSADASPIDEKDAAAKAGLGVLGKNSLLINHVYGSYVFIGTIITDLQIDCTAIEPMLCADCGRCANACPSGTIKTRDYAACLSAISQKKKRSEEELELLRSQDIAWGCDICQDVCPLNNNVLHSPISFFGTDLICEPTSQLVSNMSDEEFGSRAFSWRGRAVIYENLVNIDK